MSRIAIPVILAMLLAPTVGLAEDLTIVRDQRAGATFGASIGGGHLGCETDDGNDCDNDEGVDGALYLALRVGWSLTPRLAIMADAWGTMHSENASRVTQGILAGVIRFWPTERFWIQAGAGVARQGINFDDDQGVGLEFQDRSGTSPAVVAGLGFELASTDTFSIDLEVRGGTSIIRDEVFVYTVAGGVGVNFY